jgi:hypothetical protein
VGGVSGSAASTGSFGSIYVGKNVNASAFVGDGSSLTGIDIPTAAAISGSFEGGGSTKISGSSTSTGSFGRVETDNLTVGGSQGSDGQVLTSTGTGVAWEEAGGADDMSWNDGTATRISGSSASTASFGRVVSPGYSNFTGRLGVKAEPTLASLQVSVAGESEYALRLYQDQAKPAMFIQQDGGGAALEISAASPAIFLSGAVGDNNFINFREDGTHKWSFYSEGSTDNMRLLDAGWDNGVQISQDATSWAAVGSDERRKTDWNDSGYFDNALDKINTLTKVGTYKSIDPVTRAYKNEEKIMVGISAQEVEAILPPAVTRNRRPIEHYPDDDTEYLGLAYQDVFVMLIKAVQELSAKVEALENE